jgi:hypothetical protein
VFLVKVGAGFVQFQGFGQSRRLGSQRSFSSEGAAEARSFKTGHSCCFFVQIGSLTKLSTHPSMAQKKGPALRGQGPEWLVTVVADSVGYIGGARAHWRTAGIVVKA